MGASAPLLAVGALVLYAYLSIAYDRFYRSLGVDPGDVGLSYTGALARSSGFVVAYLVVAGFLVAGPAILTLARPQVLRKNRALFNTLLGLAGLVLIVSLIFPMAEAGRAAGDVRADKPVGPIHPPLLSTLPFLPTFPVLAVHADPATVEPAGKSGEAPAAERLRDRKLLLYLGQADGTIVLYDPHAQQAVYAPASSVVLYVSNCIVVPSRNPACSQFRRR